MYCVGRCWFGLFFFCWWEKFEIFVLEFLWGIIEIVVIDWVDFEVGEYELIVV